MKNSILLFLVIIIVACSGDDSSGNSNEPIVAENPVYLDANGITIKAREWALAGDQGEINGVTYTVVDNVMLREMVDNGERI